MIAHNFVVFLIFCSLHTVINAFQCSKGILNCQSNNFDSRIAAPFSNKRQISSRLSPVAATGTLTFPLAFSPAQNKWTVWTFLSLLSTTGLLSERYAIGRAISSPICTMAGGMLLCNLGLIPSAHPVYDTVMKFVVPLSIPVLLLDADIKKCISQTGSLLKAFIIGSIGSLLGSLVAYKVVPMTSIIGSKKITAALCARHIGGAVNFVAVSEILEIPANVIAASLAADNVVVAIYFAFLFAIGAPERRPRYADKFKDTKIERREVTKEDEEEASVAKFANENSSTGNVVAKTEEADSKCPLPLDLISSTFSSKRKDDQPDTEKSTIDSNDSNYDGSFTNAVRKNTIVRRFSQLPLVTSLSAALSVSFLCVYLATGLSQIMGISPLILSSFITTIAATLYPNIFSELAKVGGAVGVLLMQFFFATVGAMGHIPTVLRLAPSLFSHAVIQISVHFLFTSTVGRRVGCSFREILIASNANVGGPTTASLMASNKNWKELILPALLIGVFGYSVGTLCGIWLLKYL